MYTQPVCVVLRNSELFRLPPERFWPFVRSGGLRRSDFVRSASGEFFPAEQFPKLWPHLIPNADQMILTALSIFALITAIGCLTRPIERGRRTRRYNDEPLQEWKKDCVWDRDERRCTYCGRRVTSSTGHVDHSVSRLNGGTNHLNNLRLACWECNQSKGSLNANQFRC